MNALETYLLSAKWKPADAMNHLQDAGIVSDNCVHPADVANTDCDRAIKFLKVVRGEF